MVTEISPAATSQIVGDERGGKKCGKGKESAKLPTEPGASSHEGERVGCILDSFGRVGLVSWRVVHFVLRGVLPPDTPMECSKVGSPIIAIGLTRSESLQTFQFKSSSPIYPSWVRRKNYPFSTVQKYLFLRFRKRLL